MLQIGVGKADITAFQEGVGMLGYGLYYNIMESIETPLWARAIVLQNQESKIAIVTCELCFITPSLKKGVIKKLSRKHKDLGYNNQNLLLNAEHTHSGPSGYSYHGLYNMNSPGFVIDIYNKIVDGIVDAILQAEDSFHETHVYMGKSEFSEDKEVGFQRSLKAYLQNPEAKKITEAERHLGIDRTMTLLKFEDKEGKILAALNWFGTHPTSLSNNNTKVCSDNKGYAAQFLEDSFQESHPNFVGIFAQGSCGDVSPKFKYNKKHDRQRGKWEGKFEDDVESAKYNGQLQYEKAREIIDLHAKHLIDSDDLDAGLLYTDFGNIQVSSKYTGGKENVRTSPSCLGVAFLQGAPIDGPGMLEPLATLTKGMSTFIKYYEHFKALFKDKEWGLAIHQKYTAQGNKKIAIESGARKIAGTHNISKLIIPAWTDEVISNLKEFHRRGALDKNPWTPQILPLQIIKLGNLALCAFPFEITTIAAQRLKKSLEDILLGKGYQEVILFPYSNAYNGYITTYEEYQVQEYEGTHTVFGEWSLAALQTEFEKLALEMLKPKEQRSLNNDINPLVFTDDDLNKFSYFKGQYYMRKLKRAENLKRLNENKRKRLEKKMNEIQSKINELN